MEPSSLQHGMSCICSYCATHLNDVFPTLPYADNKNFITRYNLFQVLRLLAVIDDDISNMCIVEASIREFHDRFDDYADI